jgi:hypothetical protein
MKQPAGFRKSVSVRARVIDADGLARQKDAQLAETFRPLENKQFPVTGGESV